MQSGREMQSTTQSTPQVHDALPLMSMHSHVQSRSFSVTVRFEDENCRDAHEWISALMMHAAARRARRWLRSDCHFEHPRGGHSSVSACQGEPVSRCRGPRPERHAAAVLQSTLRSRWGLRQAVALEEEERGRGCAKVLRQRAAGRFGLGAMEVLPKQEKASR